MSFYNQRKPYRNYRGGRRHSDSFSDESAGGRKKYPRRSGGNNGPNRSEINIDTPLFKEPLSPHRSPQTGRRHVDVPYVRRQEPYFDARDMPQFVEPEHSGAPWGWDNYTNDCKNWQDKHKLAYYRSRCLALEFENQMLFEQINSLVEENCILAAERGVTPSMHLPDIPGKSKPEAKSRSTRSPEKNKKEAAAKEKSEKETKKKDEENKKTEGPKLPMGVQRKAELDELYGKKAELIQGLETSIQLSFNRNCDVHKPELWMAVPLNPKSVEIE